MQGSIFGLYLEAGSYYIMWYIMLNYSPQCTFSSLEYKILFDICPCQGVKLFFKKKANSIGYKMVSHLNVKTFSQHGFNSYLHFPSWNYISFTIHISFHMICPFIFSLIPPLFCVLYKELFFLSFQILNTNFDQLYVLQITLFFLSFCFSPLHCNFGLFGYRSMTQFSCWLFLSFSVSNLLFNPLIKF